MDTKLKKRLGSFISSVEKRGHDKELVIRAFEFARLAHAGEKRLSGVETIWHPLETAVTVTEWNLDTTSVVAALLHDTIEHGAATKVDVAENFGNEVLDLVEGVTKVSQVKMRGRDDKEKLVENLRKMFLAMAKDLRVVLLRFAERIDNLKTLDFLPVEKRVPYARESLEIFSPLAERLDMWNIKTQIDELAFRYAMPSEYKTVKKMTGAYYRDVQQNIEEMKHLLSISLEKAGIYTNIYGRKKGLFSIFNKLKRPEIAGDINRIHDIVALRIITESERDCYVALGVLHSLFKPADNIPVSDFISVPKPNGYRSIHTKVVGPGGKIAEVQIRTYEMHEEAEYGTASHIAYGEAKSKGVSDEVLESGKVKAQGKKLKWVQQLAQWQKEIKDSGEFIKAVRFDILSKRIFVFSPRGDVYDLPVNSTPVDYAYAVHTDLGRFIKSAKVNGKIVPLDYKMSNGDVVTIEKLRKPKNPSVKWMDSAITVLARREIGRVLKNTGDEIGVKR